MLYENEEEYERVGELLYRHYNKKGIGKADARLKRKNGSLVDVHICTSPINPGDLSEGVIFTILDITEQKITQKMLLEYKKAVESSEDSICVLDRDYKYIFANKAYLKLRSKTWNEVVGHTTEEITGKNAFNKYFKKQADSADRKSVV